MRAVLETNLDFALPSHLIEQLDLEHGDVRDPLLPIGVAPANLHGVALHV
jgi:hypothetical protein